MFLDLLRAPKKTNKTRAVSDQRCFIVSKLRLVTADNDTVNFATYRYRNRVCSRFQFKLFQKKEVYYKVDSYPSSSFAIIAIAYTRLWTLLRFKSAPSVYPPGPDLSHAVDLPYPFA